MKAFTLLIFLSIYLTVSCSDSCEDLFADCDDDTPNMCIDETLINLESPCPTVVEPVCGCDGVTYNNSCEAFNWNGVIAYSEGPCE